MSVLRVVKKFRQILSKHQKFRIIELCILMIIGGFMEMLSVSMILPFMEAVMDPERIMSNSIVSKICDLLGIESYRTFLVFLSLIVALLYIIKNVFLLFQMFVQNRFVNNNSFLTQKLLLRSYLLKPYEYFLNVKSGDVLQIINNDTAIVFKLLSNLLFLFTELAVSLSLAITILLMSPGITFGVAALMLIMVGIIQTIIRPVLSKVGEDNRLASIGIQQWLLQTVQGIKELKIARAESFFEKKYNEYGRTSVRSTYLLQTLSAVPRFLIEAVSMASFFAVLSLMIYRGYSLEDLIPILSVVAFAAIRLLPSINRITNSLATIAYSEPSLNKMCERLMDIKEEYQELLHEDSVSPIPNGMIETFDREVVMSHVNYRYPERDKDVLSDACFQIKKGQSVGIIGNSGSGKTTAIDILLGLLDPYKGEVRIDGKKIKDDFGGWLSQIGYIPQTIYLLDGDIRSNVAFGVDPNLVDDDKIWNALHDAALDEFVRGLPDGLDTELGERGVKLSGGQRQRIGIARALYLDPLILFFDEATSALDMETETAIMDSINKLRGSKTMIIIAHRLSTIESCDCVYKVENGKINRVR